MAGQSGDSGPDRTTLGPVIAHRGYSSQAPENTRAAFEAAIEVGCDMIELDARLTADGRIVVLHDDDLDRYGYDGHASAMTLAELTALDAGSWFESHYQDERFLSLAGALEVIGDRVPVNIELKLDQEGRGEDAVRLVDGVLEAVAAAGPATILYSSFSAKVLRELRRREPECRAALLVGHLLGLTQMLGQPRRQPLFQRVAYLIATVIPRLLDEGAEGLHVHRSLAGPEVLGAAREAGVNVRVFTVNDLVSFRRLLIAGWDGIFTDQVEILGQVARTLRGGS